MEFKDKRVLVTGASRGIGFAAAQRFLEGGARVVINGRSEAGVKAAAEALGQRDRVFGIGADIAAVAGCEYLVSETIAILGGIDVLVVSAGVATLAPIEETTEAVFDSMLDTNLKGLFFTSRAAIPALRESKGCITYVASDSGVRGEAYLSAYCASKAAVINLAKSLALELAPDVRVNCVSPGYVDTDMIRRDAIEQAEDPAGLEARLKGTTPLGRFAAPSEVAAAICYLSGAEAGFVTGTSLSIDGGTTAGSMVEF